MKAFTHRLAAAVALIALGAALSMLGRAQLLAIWRTHRSRKAQERFAP